MKKAGVLLLSVFAIGFSGCAHKALEKDIDQKMETHGDVSQFSELRRHTSAAIEDSKSLTPDQKSQLIALRDEIRQKSDGLHDQSMRLRAVLVDELLSSDYNDDEVQIIKKRIQTNEKERLSLILNSVDKANNILGRQVASAAVVRELLGDLGGARVR